jgi:uncharacterized integral membrane protein
MTDAQIADLIARIGEYHEADRLRDEILLAEVKKLTDRTIASLDDANAASDVRTKIVQRATTWNTQWLKLAIGALILLGLLVLVIVYNDPDEIAKILRTFLLPLLTAILGFAVYLLGVEAPQKIEKQSSELAATDHRPDPKHPR